LACCNGFPTVGFLFSLPPKRAYVAESAEEEVVGGNGSGLGPGPTTVSDGLCCLPDGLPLKFNEVPRVRHFLPPLDDTSQNSWQKCSTAIFADKFLAPPKNSQHSRRQMLERQT